MKPVKFTPSATVQWLKLAPNIRQRINTRLEQFASTGQGDVKRLKGRSGVRLRVGDWRVIFYEEHGTIIVTDVDIGVKSTTERLAMTVRFETTPKGEMAILPRAEYERLKAVADEASEDAGTARLVARARKEVAEGTPLLPKKTVDRLADGENPIRVLREFRGRTQVELVVAVGTTQGHLSDLETGKRKGPLALHQKIAQALGVPLELLAPIAVSDEETDPVRFANRKRAVTEMIRQRRRR